MNQYKIKLEGPREKVKIIKCIRLFGPFGLKQAKDMVEANISFADWMDDTVTFTLTVTAEQFGNFEAERYFAPRAYEVLDVELVKPARVDFNLADNPPR